MIVTEKLKKLLTLEQNISSIIQNSSLTDFQLENFLKVLEKTRYNILTEIKLYNKTIKFEYEKLKTMTMNIRLK